MTNPQRGARVRILHLAIVTLLTFFGVAGSIAQDHSTATQSQVRSSQPVQLEGDLQILYQDLKDHSRLSYSLKLSDGTRVPLHFVKEPPTHLLTGDHVRANGQLSGGALLLYSGNTNLSSQTTSSNTAGPAAPAAPLPNTFGAQSTLVIVVNFQDAPSNQPWTPAQVQSEVFGTSGLTGYVQEASYGQTSLTGDVAGWYTIPLNSTTCDTNQIATDANSAASAAGFNLSSYTRFIYLFPYTSACGFAGAATVGGNPSQSWVNGGGTTTNTLNLGIFAHEMGHNFGLYHSHGLDCGSVILSGQCTVWEYFDSLDVMGSGAGHYNSFQKSRLGWLNYRSSPPITTATTSGTYTLAPYESTDSNSEALKVLKFSNPTTGSSYYYYIEYRQPVGFDSGVAPSPANGVVIRLAQDGAPNSSDLLDMTPNSSRNFNWNYAALTVGNTYSDPDAGVAITMQSAGTDATVSLSITQPTCLRALPGVSISPSQITEPAGTTVNYAVTVSNNDSASCGPSTFSLQTSVAYGWTYSLSNSQVTVNPGASSSQTLSVTSASNSNNGPNPVGITATSNADFVYSASGSATYTIGVPINVSVVTNQNSYSGGQTVVESATVTSQGNPVPNASVAFAVSDPNSNLVCNGSGTTGNNGTASFSCKLSHHPAKGIYGAKGQTSSNGSSSNGSTNFQVQ